jgi:hypothetical protein
VIEALGDVLAELPDRAAAPGAAAGRRIDDPLARQVLGQWPARRPAPRAGTHLGPRRWCRELGRGHRLGLGLLELGQPQLELLDEPGPALGGLAVPLTPRLGEQQLQALDLETEGGDLAVLASDRGVPLGEPRLGGAPCRTLGMQHRVRRGEIVGQGVEAVHAAGSST